MFLKLEAGLAIAALLTALAFPNLGSRWFEALEGIFGKLARRRGLSVAVVGLTALALRVALVPILPIPHPLVQDEFGQLLTADTFAHGRLTNPTPHLWTHFESLMIIMKPTYNSKYPPAQSLFLAAGQLVFGHPFWGVLLSLGLMCAAICWMLQAWVGEGWALLGGFFAVARIAAFSYWANCYCGGAVAAMGGALVLGALPRLKRERRVRNALLMGLGLAVLANSRPYEGLILSIPVAVALFAWMLGRNRPEFSVSLRRVVFPLCLLLGITAAWMGYYNWRVTGNALRLPYMASASQYDPTPHFLWESMGAMPKYRHPVMKAWEDGAAQTFMGTRTSMGLILTELVHAMIIWLFNFGPLFTLPLVLALVTLPYGFSWRSVSPPSRFLLVALVVSLASVAPEVFYYPRYSAPMTCLGLAIVLLAMRRLRPWQSRRRPAGLCLVRSIAAFTFLLLLVRVCVSPFHVRSELACTPWSPRTYMTSPVGRCHVLPELMSQSGRDLVLVRYSPTLYVTSIHKDDIWPPDGVWEWAYNSANINDQKVIWAHDMGQEKNQELIDYYKNRRVWLLYADDQPPRLVPYGETGSVSGKGEKGKKGIAVSVKMMHK